MATGCVPHLGCEYCCDGSDLLIEKNINEQLSTQCKKWEASSALPPAWVTCWLSMMEWGVWRLQLQIEVRSWIVTFGVEGVNISIKNNEQAVEKINKRRYAASHLLRMSSIVYCCWRGKGVGGKSILCMGAVIPLLVLTQHNLFVEKIQPKHPCQKGN